MGGTDRDDAADGRSAEPDPDADEAAAAPLADLARAVRERRDPGSDGRAESTDAGGPSPERADEDGGRAADSPGDEGLEPTTRRRAETFAGGWLPAYPSRRAVVAHGGFTVAMLVIACLTYLGAATAVLPRHLWVVSLPFLAIGLFGFLPIAAWVLRVWNPRELG